MRHDKDVDEEKRSMYIRQGSSRISASGSYDLTHAGLDTHLHTALFIYDVCKMFFSSGMFFYFWYYLDLCASFFFVIYSFVSFVALNKCFIYLSNIGCFLLRVRTVTDKM